MDRVFDRVSAINDAQVEVRRELARENLLSQWDTQELYDAYSDIEMTEETLARFKRYLFMEMTHRHDESVI